MSAPPYTVCGPVELEIPPYAPITEAGSLALPDILSDSIRPRFGWLCPVCKRGIAPDVKHCDHGHAPPK